MLWPLFYFNHRLIWQADMEGMPTAPAIPATAAAVRHLTGRIMALAILGYGAWAIFQLGISLFESPLRAQPWWVRTSLMSWSYWLALAILAWISAPMLAFLANRAAGLAGRRVATYAELLGIAGLVLFVYPILSFAASLLVMVVKVSLVKSWTTEGTVFTASYYYRNVFRAAIPWFLLGGGMMFAGWLLRRPATTTSS